MDATEQAEFDRISGALEAATARNTELSTSLDTATGRYQDLFHRTNFAAVALAAGVDPKAVDTFYLASGYQAGSDDFDTDAATALINANRDRLSFCFAAPAPTSTATTPSAAAPKATPPTAPGGSRGPSTPPTAARLRITRAQQADVAFMVTNDRKIKEAAAKGLLEFE